MNVDFVCVIFCVYMHACVRACRSYVVTRVIVTEVVTTLYVRPSPGGGLAELVSFPVQ